VFFAFCNAFIDLIVCDPSFQCELCDETNKRIWNAFNDFIVCDLNFTLQTKNKAMNQIYLLTLNYIVY